jgi:hypothetical protein
MRGEDGAQTSLVLDLQDLKRQMRASFPNPLTPGMKPQRDRWTTVLPAAHDLMLDAIAGMEL